MGNSCWGIFVIWSPSKIKATRDIWGRIQESCDIEFINDDRHSSIFYPLNQEFSLSAVIGQFCNVVLFVQMTSIIYGQQWWKQCCRIETTIDPSQAFESLWSWETLHTLPGRGISIQPTSKTIKQWEWSIKNYTGNLHRFCVFPVIYCWNFTLFHGHFV